jgi:hypothetical protein
LEQGKSLMTTKNKPSLKRKLIEAGGWKLARRVAKQIPFVGSALAIGLVGYDVKKKGFVKGVVNSGLDAIPFVGTGKNVIELFTGDLLSDKENSNSQKRMPVEEEKEL